MVQVLSHHSAAQQSPDSRAVHQLRKALRRCRTLAAGLQAIDPDPEWQEMLHASRALFRSLGGLRDTHVLLEWLDRLAAADEPGAQVLRYRLHARAVAQAATARTALQAFDRAVWRHWSERLTRRADRHPPGGPLFEQLAMRRLVEAHELHRRAIKGGSAVAWHRLRIGIKRLRYAVENFLPELHQAWGGDLGTLQDALGDVHDLDVLRHELQQAQLLDDPAGKATWTARLGEVRERRLGGYRALMTGSGSRWRSWERELLEPARVDRATLAAVGSWADHHGARQAVGVPLARRVARSLETFTSRAGDVDFELARRIGPVAARLYASGRGRRSRYRLALTMPLPVGWDAADLVACAAIAANLGRRRFKAARLDGFEALPAPTRQAARLVDAVARLSATLAAGPDPSGELVVSPLPIGGTVTLPDDPAVVAGLLEIATLAGLPVGLAMAVNGG